MKKRAIFFKSKAVEKNVAVSDVQNSSKEMATYPCSEGPRGLCRGCGGKAVTR